MKLKLSCDWCGKPFEKERAKVTPHNFCSRACLWAFSSKAKNPGGYDTLRNLEPMRANMSEVNRRLNPVRMTDDVREKLRQARLDSGTTHCYRKLYGRHEHRTVMEQILGRPLRPGEVVHHIDGNKRNNSPDNLMLFASQTEHARWHKKAGDLK